MSSRGTIFGAGPDLKERLEHRLSEFFHFAQKLAERSVLMN